MEARSDSEGGYLVPDIYIHGGWFWTSKPRTDWRRVFRLTGSFIIKYITVISLKIISLATGIEQLGYEPTRKYMKGLLKVAEEQNMTLPEYYKTRDDKLDKILKNGMNQKQSGYNDT